MPKEDCKYWDKCYQRNALHLQKYNHPEKAGCSNEGREMQSEVDRKKKVMPEDDETTRTKFQTDELRKEALGNIAGKNYMEILQKRIKLSVQAEYDELLRTNEFIRHKFLVEMPSDFYAFWKFAVSLVKKDNVSGEDVLEYMEKQFQLALVGPFEFLAGRFHNAQIHEPGDYLRHWRFYYDPAEFQTIFIRKNTGKHYGYWRDTPKEKDGLLIARNESGCEFDFIATNAFDAFVYFLDKDFSQTPFNASSVSNVKKALGEFVKTNEVQLDKLELLMKARSSRVVTRTFHRLGIVVPVDKKTRVGYRPLIISDAELKNIIKLFEESSLNGDGKDDVKTVVMEKLQPVATAASIAVDECDFGTSLELGIDLFCSGRIELHSLVLSLLVPAYTLLNRPQFIAITKAHLEDRKRSLNLSIFELNKKQ